MGQNNKGDGGETKWNGGGKWKWSTSVQMFDWDRRSYVEFENTPRILRQIFAYTEQSAELTHRRTNQLQAFGTRWGRTTMVMEGAPHGILMETMNDEVSSRGGDPLSKCWSPRVTCLFSRIMNAINLAYLYSDRLFLEFPGTILWPSGLRCPWGWIEAWSAEHWTSFPFQNISLEKTSNDVIH